MTVQIFLNKRENEFIFNVLPKYCFYIYLCHIINFSIYLYIQNEFFQLFKVTFLTDLTNVRCIKIFEFNSFLNQNKRFDSIQFGVKISDSV